MHLLEFPPEVLHIIASHTVVESSNYWAHDIDHCINALFVSRAFSRYFAPFFAERFPYIHPNFYSDFHAYDGDETHPEEYEDIKADIQPAKLAQIAVALELWPAWARAIKHIDPGAEIKPTQVTESLLEALVKIILLVSPLQTTLWLPIHLVQQVVILEAVVNAYQRSKERFTLFAHRNTRNTSADTFSSLVEWMPYVTDVSLKVGNEYDGEDDEIPSALPSYPHLTKFTVQQVECLSSSKAFDVLSDVLELLPESCEVVLEQKNWDEPTFEEQMQIVVDEIGQDITNLSLTFRAWWPILDQELFSCEHPNLASLKLSSTCLISTNGRRSAEFREYWGQTLRRISRNCPQLHHLSLNINALSPDFIYTKLQNIALFPNLQTFEYTCKPGVNYSLIEDPDWLINKPSDIKDLHTRYAVKADGQRSLTASAFAESLDTMLQDRGVALTDTSMPANWFWSQPIETKTLEYFRRRREFDDF